MQFPPKKTRYEEEEEERKRQEREAKKNKKIPGIVMLDDLLSGEYHRKKEAEKMRKQKLRETKRKILQRQELEFIYDDPEYVSLQNVFG